MISVIISNTQQELHLPYGTLLQDICHKYSSNLKHKPLGALVNNQVRSLHYRIHKSCNLTFFDITSTFGNGVYLRSVCFVLYKALHDLFPEVKLNILHSISGGKYCTLDNLITPIDENILTAIKNRMNEIIADDFPFIRKEVPTQQALELFDKQNLLEEKSIFQNSNKLYLTLYHLDNVYNYYYGALLPSTSYLTLFGLELYENGLLLKIPEKKNPTGISRTHKMPKLFDVYKSFKEWGRTLGVPYVQNLNEKIKSNEISDLILTTEALQEKEWSKVADEIHCRNSKMVLISGPSSSGKTTSCKRLSVQLSVFGYHPVQISVDDFFVEREETPRDKNGEFDFEALEAIDLKIFNKTLSDLLDGKEVELPVFNFQLGKKEWKGKTIKMQKQSILVIEGIHCLNPKLTNSVSEDIKYKVFVSALTSLSIDSQNPIPTTDTRLIRRIVRDYNYRGYSALDTLRRWQSVRNGEEKNIFPYQENADKMFNTSLIYELSVLRPYIMPALLEVPEYEPEFAEAVRLIKFLSFFKPINETMIPPLSILREFVGGSKFTY